jgi:hypothetical protein
MKNLRELDLNVKQSVLVVANAKDAEWALAKVTGNRRLSAGVVKRYRSIMEDGNWQDDHPDPIIFDEHGRLMNGQHRLTALTQAKDKQFLMAVRTMEPIESIMAIDAGYKRLAADQIRMYANLSVSHSLISSVRYWNPQENTIIGQTAMGNGLVSPQRYLSVLDSHPDEIGVVAKLFATNIAGITNAAVGCAMLVGAKVKPVQTAEFIAELKSPASTVAQAAMLKTWLLGSGRSGLKGNTWVKATLVFGHALYALQAYIDGRKFVRWPTTYPRTIRS